MLVLWLVRQECRHRSQRPLSLAAHHNNQVKFKVEASLVSLHQQQVVFLVLQLNPRPAQDYLVTLLVV